MTNASIITIGDELLIGQVVDTNSAFIAQELNKEGILVKRRVAVGDNTEDIKNALDEEGLQSQIIIITGGLGPTSDDITKPLLCKYFKGKMVVNEEARENVKYLFERVFKRPITEINLKQAEVPDVCTVIQNKRGTAPGMIFHKGGKIFVSLPGVPHEMKGMIEPLINMIKTRFTSGTIVHRTLLTAGIGESALAEKIKDFEKDLPTHIKLAYLPNYGMVRLRLSSSGESGIEKEVDEKFEKLKSLVKEFLVTDRDEPLEKVVGDLLLAKNKTLSTAESCTGGYIAHLITSIAGSSKYFKGSVVSYDNEVKENVLNVSSGTLKNYGAVSEETVIEMVAGVLKTLNTDYAVAVSGIMGPDGGTDEKPVGTVWIAVGKLSREPGVGSQEPGVGSRESGVGKREIEVRTLKLNLRFDRMRNIQLTAVNALNFLRKMLTDD